MGMQRMFNVTCDLVVSNDCLEMVDGSEWYASLARQEAKLEGWVRVKGQDVCPECMKELKARYAREGL